MQAFVPLTSKYDINDPKPGGTYKILAIRHAESLWNAYSYKMKTLGKKATKEIARVNYEPLKLSKDPQITELGVQ